MSKGSPLRPFSSSDGAPKKPKGWMSLKSYRLGYKAAKNGEPSTSCPFEIDDETKKLLLKRHRWLMGWEDFSFKAPTGKRLKKEQAVLEQMRKDAKKKRKKKKKHHHHE